MRHSFSTSDEVAHRFANRTQNHAYCRNASFTGNDFKSYSTTVAKHVELNGQHAVLITTYNYSSTTNKHLRQLVWACNHLHIIRCEQVDAGDWDHTQNYDDYLRKHAALVSKIQKARFNALWPIHDYHELRGHMLAYKNLFSLDWQIPPVIPNLEGIIAACAERRRIHAWTADVREAGADERRTARQEKTFANWLSGKTHVISDFMRQTIKLRVYGDEIQTTRGASIPVSDAIKMWPTLKLLHDAGRPYTPQIPIMFGSYQMTFFKSDVLCVGCHQIPYSEIEHIAQQLGLIHEEATV